MTPLEQAARAIRFATLAAYRLSFSGSPNARAASGWINAPQSGDMVCETSSAYMHADHLIAVGRLLRTAWEPLPGDFGEDVEPPKEKVFYIECLDGIERRWTNANFIRVAETNQPWATSSPSGSGLAAQEKADSPMEARPGVEPG